MNTIIATLLLSLWLAPADTAQAEALIKSGHLKQARALLEAAYRANPKDARTLYLLSRVRSAFGDPEAALQLAEQALAIDSSKADYHRQVAALSGQLAQNANMFRKMTLGGRLKKEAEAAISLDPKHTAARSLMVVFYLQAPGIMGGDKKKARDMADEIARIDPVEGAFAQAQIARIEKDQAGVEAAYVKATQANPQHYGAHTVLANFYTSDTQKKYDAAEKYARAALKIDPTRSGAYSLLAILLAQNQRLNELDTLLAQSEKNVSDNLGPFYQAGRILLTQGMELPRAESYFRKYLTQEPEAGNPDHAAAHWRLGLALEKLGKKQEAISELEKAVQMRPTFEDARKDLKRLKST